ncbi:MAG: Rha family transcriptional regulator [Rhodocyclaceae bacterium]|nr:Rha family transcriptional regulator [Rhodocyclaceae bacterium]
MDMETALKPRVSVVGRSVTTTSIAIAEHFGKLHKDVLKAIRNLASDLPEAWCKRNFEPTSVSVKQPNGGTREESAYRITRKGFSLLAMGFTGQRALRWKLAYIEAFDAMEAALNPREATRPEPPAPWLVTPRRFLEIYYALGRRIGAAMLLWVLLELGADEGWVQITMRDLIDELGGNLSLGAIAGNVKRLQKAGLLDVQAHPNTGRRCYFVHQAPLYERIAALRARPEPPGLPDLDDVLVLEAPEKLQ